MITTFLFSAFEVDFQIGVTVGLLTKQFCLFFWGLGLFLFDYIAPRRLQLFYPAFLVFSEDEVIF